jgi:hypothetical protein
MKNKKLFILIAIVLIAGWFYWFQYRPSKIKSYCSWAVMWDDKGPKCSNNRNRNSEKSECYDLNYKNCLHEKGL